ncbi:MAG: ComEC family competence protein [Chryseobacterium sp.]|uniref:ComEC/Rec2 family competence protein n=1 Tax=Chryseobacterium sp. TaxID=1871047 RepID=UPI0025C318D1|nr:ComEC/Rec2 family competence protein [Chryseobacterium sp.]MCJ7933478.1 ComEC family competence protein [Chryseobacterium sp.]
MGNTAMYGSSAVGTGILILMFFHSFFLSKVKSVLLALLFFYLGIIFHFFNTFSPVPGVTANKKETVVFRIVQKLNSTEKYKKYEGAAQVEDKSFNMIFYIPKDHAELDFKHSYKGKALIIQVKSPQYDFQFDYAKYLQRKNIEYQCYLLQGLSSAEKRKVSFVDKIRQQRLEVLQKMDTGGMSGEAKNFLKGIILADRTEIDGEILQDFNRSGLIHLLAISGTHIVVIFGIFYFLLVKMVPLRFRHYAIVFSLVFIWMFAMFIGFGNSVLRSCIMLSIYFIYLLLQRKPDLLHSLALSAFIILISDTQQLFDIGFQLSFLAVLGIFWFNQPLLKHFPKQDHYLKKIIFNTITISISAQLATLPLVLYYFHQFSFISVIANFIIVPFSELIIVFSFLMTVLFAFQINFGYLDWAYDLVIRILLKAIHWFAEVDILFFENIPMNLVEMGFIFIAVYFLKAVIVKCSLNNSMRFLMSVLTFLIIRACFNVFENQREEIVFQHFNKSPVFSVKSGNRACFWTSEIIEEKKVIRYVVAPYCSSRRIARFELKTFPPSAQKVVFRGHTYDLK